MALPNSEETRLRVAEIVESFPEATATLTVGLHLKLEVRDKSFGWFMEDHHGDGRLAVNCKAYPGVAAAKVKEDSLVYHIPKYVGHKGWIGIWVDVPSVNWEEVKNLLYDGYVLAAPRSLLKSLG